MKLPSLFRVISDPLANDRATPTVMVVPSSASPPVTVSVLPEVLMSSAINPVEASVTIIESSFVT